MDIETLRRLLDRAVRTVSIEPKDSTIIDPIRVWIASRRPNVASDALSELIIELGQQPDLFLFDGKMRFLMNESLRVDYKMLAEWLIFRALQVGTEIAFADLARYIEDPIFECLEVCALGGIKIEEPLPLSRDIELVPFSDAPDHFLKGELENRSFRPDAALVRKIMHPRIHLDPGKQWPDQHLYLCCSGGLDRLSGELEDARLCLTLIGQIGPAWFGSYVSTAEWVPLGGSRLGISAPLIELRESQSLDLNEYDRAREVYEQFQKIPPNEKTRLRVPLRRLNSATCRYSIIDSAIDLGIAMEAIFLNDLGDDPGELNYRLRLRASRLLGDNEKSRRDLYKLFGDLYFLRSKAVHTGELKDKEPRLKGKETGPLLNDGFRYAKKAIDLIIRNRKVDWQTVTLA